MSISVVMRLGSEFKSQIYHLLPFYSGKDTYLSVPQFQIYKRMVIVICYHRFRENKIDTTNKTLKIMPDTY